jgi:hypothetical protein
MLKEQGVPVFPTVPLKEVVERELNADFKGLFNRNNITWL